MFGDVISSVWNEQAAQFWVIMVAGAVIVWAYYEFWRNIIEPWVKRRSMEGHK